MFTRELLIELLRHMEWADAKVWAAVPESEPGDARLMQWLVHVHVVQRAFFAVWTGADPRLAFRKPEEFASIQELRHWGHSYYAPAHDFIGGMSAERLGAPLVMPWAAQIAEQIGRPIGPTTIGETCFQVASHSTYHRGQVNARLRETGAEPPLVDYIAWLWFGRPEPDWKA
jgi:uncharacterized damage-inducible protein DinB